MTNSFSPSIRLHPSSLPISVLNVSLYEIGRLKKVWLALNRAWDALCSLSVSFSYVIVDQP